MEQNAKQLLKKISEKVATLTDIKNFTDSTCT